MQLSRGYTDLMVIKDINLLLDSKIIIYGTGKSGKHFYKEMIRLGVNVYCFCETQPHNKELYGLPVISQEELAVIVQKEEILIVVASVYFNEIYDDLIYKGIEGKGIISNFTVAYSIYLNINEKKISEDYRADYKKIVNVWKKIQMRYVEGLKLSDDFRILSSAVMFPEILIFQPGKVGSMSIHSTLKKYGILSYHCHMLNNRIMNKDKEYQELLHILKNRKIKIITGVREPIARAFSSFVHCLGQYYGWLVNDELSNDLCESFISYLKEYVCNDNEYKEEAPKFNGNEYCALGNQMGNEFTWFDKELKEVFGVDVFKYYFDYKAGYSIIKQGNIEIFLYKLEKLKDIQKEIGEFAGVSDFKLDSDNIGSNKITRNLDKQLKHEVRIPDECLNYYYKDNIKYSHFYSDDETKEFMKKWSKKEN